MQLHFVGREINLSHNLYVQQGTLHGRAGIPRLNDRRKRNTYYVTQVDLKIPRVLSMQQVSRVRCCCCQSACSASIAARGPLRLSPLPSSLPPSLSLGALTRDVTRPQTAIRHSAHFADAHAHPLSLSFAFVSPRSKIRHYQTAAAAAAREEPNNEPILRHPENGK